VSSPIRESAKDKRNSTKRKAKEPQRKKNRGPWGGLVAHVKVAGGGAGRQKKKKKGTSKMGGEREKKG